MERPSAVEPSVACAILHFSGGKISHRIKIEVLFPTFSKAEVCDNSSKHKLSIPVYMPGLEDESQDVLDLNGKGAHGCQAHEVLLPLGAATTVTPA